MHNAHLPSIIYETSALIDSLGNSELYLHNSRNATSYHISLRDRANPRGGARENQISLIWRVVDKEGIEYISHLLRVKYADM